MTEKKQSNMISLSAGLVLVVAAMLSVTVVSGNLTQRWSRFRGLEESQKLLRELPRIIGDWESDPQQDTPLAKEDVAMLQIENGYIVRKYRNAKSAAEVNLVFMVGPTGRIVVHTPEICFGGRAYQKEGARIAVKFPLVNDPGSGRTDNSFWKVSFVNQLATGDSISFYYGISAGDVWLASEDSRTALQRYRYVYKLQVQAMDDGETDNVHLFLSDCLPTIHDFLRPCQ